MSSDRLWIEEFTFFRMFIVLAVLGLIVIIGAVAGIATARQKDNERTKKKNDEDKRISEEILKELKKNNESVKRN